MASAAIMANWHNETGILTTSNATGGYGNETLFLHPGLCTLKTCDLSLAQLLYIPTLGGNALYTAIFAVYLLAQIVLGVKHRTWGYMAAMFFGLVRTLIRYHHLLSLTSFISCLKSSVIFLESGCTSTHSATTTSWSTSFA